MKSTLLLKKIEFEARIFISLAIVILACVISIVFFRNSPAIYVQAFEVIGLEKFSPFMFLFASAFMAAVSVLRMWAGSLLSSFTVMSFKVQCGSVVMTGPYLLVRNPIYFADLSALTVCSLFLPLPGLLIPALFYFHYRQLIIYEEQEFTKQHTEGYGEYLSKVQRLIPSVKSLFRFIRNSGKVYLNRDGIRHNALFVLFIPGFIAGYFYDSFLLVVLIGAPAVIDWAVIHTVIGLPEITPRQRKSKVFSRVLYSQCWEDPQLDRIALNIRKDDVVFSITSGGCNLLSFLIDDPKEIIALDLNPHQNNLLELKMAAFKSLPYDKMLCFLGVRNCSESCREYMYDTMSFLLTPQARKYWDSNSEQVRKGIIHCGRYEDYMKLLRNLLGLIVSKETMEELFNTDSPEERRLLFDKKWNNLRWKIFTKVLLSRRTMSLLFDKAFFRYLEDDFSFGAHFAEKVRRALTVLPVRENYFLRYILFGNYDESYLPPYLRRENFELIRDRLDRVKIVTDSCGNFFRTLPGNSISGFNFTNIFEWIPGTEFEELLNETARVAQDGAVITYRNLLVPREHPESLSDAIIPERESAHRLHEMDLSFIYDRYVVERISKRELQCHTELSEYQQAVS